MGGGVPGARPQRTAARPERGERPEATRRAAAFARVGLVARAGFYAVLAYLIVRIGLLREAHAGGSGGPPANAQGALSLVARGWLGDAALAVAAAGFLTLGGVRLWAAWHDRRPGRGRRLTVAGQGLLYLALAAVPLRFLAGARSTGGEQQQHRAAGRLLGFPGGAVLVVAAGIALVLVCAWQVRGALRQDFTDGLDLGGASPRVRRLVRVTGTVGITGRALVFLPTGVFLVAAGVTVDPQDSRGLDGELLLVAGHAWGDVLLLVVALALATFALYSLFEARYRDLSRSV